MKNIESVSNALGLEQPRFLKSNNMLTNSLVIYIIHVLIAWKMYYLPDLVPTTLLWTHSSSGNAGNAELLYKEYFEGDSV